MEGVSQQAADHYSQGQTQFHLGGICKEWRECAHWRVWSQEDSLETQQYWLKHRGGGTNSKTQKQSAQTGCGRHGSHYRSRHQ